MSPETVIPKLALFAVLLGSLVAHEWAHAWTATLLGDPTPRLCKRLSLNPFRHFDPIGGAMLFLLAWTGAGIGWAKPLPLSPVELKRPVRDTARIAAAGPLSNLLLASLAGGISHVTPSPVWGLVVWVNLSLALFNLLPLFPLDGHRLLWGAVPDRWREKGEPAVIRWGVLPLLLLLFLEWLTPVKLFSGAIFPAVQRGTEIILTVSSF